MSAYPITQQTQVIEEISRFIDEGERGGSYIPVESEHSAPAAMGAVASESRVAVDFLREHGHRCGLVRARSLRPFPVEELRELLAPLQAVMVVDRGVSFGMEGALYSEVKAAVYGYGDCRIYDLVTGLGGRDVPYDVIVENMEAALRGELSTESRWPTVRLNEHHELVLRSLEEYWKKEGAR